MATNTLKASSDGEPQVRWSALLADLDAAKEHAKAQRRAAYERRDSLAAWIWGDREQAFLNAAECARTLSANVPAEPCRPDGGRGQRKGLNET